jgi:hypothetical protein
MSEIFFDIVSGTGRGIKASWNAVSGVSMIKKRNMDIDTADIQGALLMLGLFGGALGGIITGAATESLTAALAVAAAGASAPVTCFLPYAVYKAGEHDKKMRLRQERYKQLEAPKPPKGLI